MTPQEIVERALDLLGSTRGTVLVERSSRAHLRWANSSLTTNGVTTDQQVHVVAHPDLVGGTGLGTASGAVRSPSDLPELVERAVAMAVSAGPARDAAPEVPARPATADWADPPRLADAHDLRAVSALLAEHLGDPDVPLYGYAEQKRDTTYLGTTAGLRLRHAQPAARFELSAKSGDRTRSAWAGRSGRDLSTLDLATAPAEVARGLAAQSVQVDVPPGRHTVLFSPSSAADLMVSLLGAASAGDAIEGHSPFSRNAGGTRIGEALTPLPFRLASDPRAPGLECADHVRTITSSAWASAFDAGLPLRETAWIDGGALRALVSSRETAERGNLPVTPEVDNVLAGVQGHEGTLDDVAARVGEGLLVTCLWYIRTVDAQNLLVTGLTRDGVYVVRGGEIVGATGNFRFNDSPLTMLPRILDAGTPTDCLPREFGDWVTRARVAPLVMADVNLSTRSEAT